MIGRFKDNLIIAQKGYGIEDLFFNEYFAIRKDDIFFKTGGYLLKNNKISTFERGSIYFNEFEKILLSNYLDKRKFLEDLIYENKKFVFFENLNLKFECKKFKSVYSSFKEAEEYVGRFIEGKKDKILLVFNELFINAYEHGNLGLSFEEKERLIREDKYCQLLKKGSDKEIEVCVAKKDNYIFVKITDEGKGFTLESKKALFNGRGIKLCEKYAYIFYNQKGNSVLLIGKSDGL